MEKEGKDHFLYPLSLYFMGFSCFSSTEWIWEKGLVCYGLNFQHQSKLNQNVVFGLYISDKNKGRTDLLDYLYKDHFCCFLLEYIKSNSTCSSLASRNCHTFMLQNKWMMGNLNLYITTEIIRCQQHLTQERVDLAVQIPNSVLKLRYLCFLCCGQHIVVSEIKGSCILSWT